MKYRVRKFRSHTTRTMEQHVKISSGLVDYNINGGNFNFHKSSQICKY